MLEPILKGLIEWIYELIIDIFSYASGELIGVMSMDLTYFETTAPVISDIVDIFIAFGWALLIGNLVFQAIKIMVSGAGFEAEDPKILFLRTFIFAFLLLASRQICELCMAISGTVITLLEMPDAITVTVPDESMFSLGSGAKWLLVIIVGIVLMFQMVKLLFEIGERYVITSVLTFFAPLAFAMGGSKNTNDIFKGWCRMYGSMLVMMIMNIVFLKLIMSAMSQMLSGGVLVWLVFIVALTRVARKIDSHIGKIGLNPAQTGNELGSRIPGVMTMVAVRTMSSLVGRSMAGAKGSAGRNGSSGSRRRSSHYRGSASSRTGTYNSSRSMGGNSSSYNAYSAHSGSNAHVSNMGNTSFGKQSTGVNSSNVNMDTELKGKSSNYGKAPDNTVNKMSGTNHSQSRANVSNSGRSYSLNRGTYSASGQSANKLHSMASNTTSVRPPISRNTGGNSPAGRNVMNSVVSSSKQSVSSNNGNVSRVNNQSTGNSFTSSTGNSSVQVKENANVSGGVNHSQSSMRANVGGSTLIHSEHTNGTHFVERNTTRDMRNNNFSHTHEKTDRRINHEYRQGKYNPAAVNRKVKKSYYKKEDLTERREMQMNRKQRGGGKNRKHKQ